MVRFVLPLLLLLAACDNVITRQYGGNTEIVLSCDQKLINATWKEMDFWYLTRPMRADEQPEMYAFTESSAYGVMEGTVTIKECR